MTQSEGFDLAQFINNNSNRFLAMALELPDESRVFVVDGANRNNKGYGLAFEPIIDVGAYLLISHDLPEEYVALLSDWYSTRYKQRTGSKPHTLPTASLQVASLSTLSAWYRSLLEHAYKSRRTAQEVSASVQVIRKNTKLMREEVRERLACAKKKTQHSRSQSSSVLADSSRCLQEINIALAAQGALLSSQKRWQHPVPPPSDLPTTATFPETGRRECSIR